MPTTEELLEQFEVELNAIDVDESLPPFAGLDRRQFVFLSLVSAAASAFGAATVARAQAASGQGQQPQQPPLALGNGESPALQFQPYPGGTGALMEKLAKERGRAAFDRAVFKVDKWRGPVPSSPDDIVFLPAHRLAALIQASRITSLQLTDIYLERLKRLNPTLLCAVTIMEEQARAEAANADAEIQA
ncbi:MAG: hypothetical protein ACREOG_01665, partial [Gemmatimonadaceae bacterium]